MKWRLLIAVLLDLSILDVASFSQGPPDEEVLPSTSSPPPVDRLFSEGGVVRFQLIQGRLGLDAPRHRKGAEEIRSEAVFESITVTAERGIPSVHYVYKSPNQDLTLSVRDAMRVRIESVLPRTGERSILEHTDFGAIRWTVERGDLVDQYAGTTLFHLRLQNHSVFDMHYAEFITRLLRGQSLGELSAQSYQAAAACLDDRTLPGVVDVQRCIDDFRSARQSTRHVAQQRLLQWGTPVLAILQQHLIQGNLDTEQTARVKQTIRLLRPLVEDTPRSLAMLLQNDREYWVLINHSLNDNQRMAVNHHLQRCGLNPIESPSGDVTRVAALP